MSRQYNNRRKKTHWIRYYTVQIKCPRKSYMGEASIQYLLSTEGHAEHIDLGFLLTCRYSQEYGGFHKYICLSMFSLVYTLKYIQVFNHSISYYIFIVVLSDLPSNWKKMITYRQNNQLGWLFKILFYLPTITVKNVT